MKRRPPWFYKQSAVIPYRSVHDRLEILLITSRRGTRWVVPKGVIDLGLSAASSACKEAYEEAGVLGAVSPEPIGEYRYEKWGGMCRVTVFALEVHTVLKRWPEDSSRERQWTTVKVAAQIVKEPKLRRLIRALPKRIS